jgi:hypothetical protein
MLWTMAKQDIVGSFGKLVIECCGDLGVPP